jgi:hypothetical protein
MKMRSPRERESERKEKKVVSTPSPQEPNTRKEDKVMTLPFAKEMMEVRV